MGHDDRVVRNFRLKQREPKIPIFDLCGWLFRNKKGGPVTEESLLPDMQLVYEMYDRGITVEDLLDSLQGIEGMNSDMVDGLLAWRRSRINGRTPLE